MRLFKHRSVAEVPAEERSATQIYLDGGGDPANERTMAILAEADRSAATQRSSGPLHAHEITAADAALIRMMAGASFGPDANVVLPSGRSITGAEMQRWLESAGE